MKPLYFDYNATSPVLPRVLRAMLPFLSNDFGNPGSPHAWGLKAKNAVDMARARLAALVNCAPDEIYFTSCATESNCLALHGVFDERKSGKLVTSAIEHPAILETAKVLRERGVTVDILPCSAEGLVAPPPEAAKAFAGADLVSVMLANNETGAIQPVAEIARTAKKAGALVHTDASQAVGKIKVDVRALGVDMLTIAGHKMYAPKGVGALYVRKGLELTPMLTGGGQERGLRAGTENVAFMAGLGEAALMASEDLVDEKTRQIGLGRRLLAGLDALGVDYRLHSAKVPRLPATMSIGFAGVAAGSLLSGLVGREVGLSAGAACHGEETSVSHVLKAMGVPGEYARGTLRFSWGRPTTTEDMDELVRRLGRSLEPLV